MTTACTIAAAVILIAGLFAVIIERTNERDQARAEVARLTREHAAELAARDALVVELDQENARLHAELTDAQVERHLRVADGDFPVHTTFDDDDLTVLMRATEEQ